MTTNQPIKNQVNEQTKQIILHTIKKQKPENTQQLITFVQEKTALSQEEIINFLIELENENKLHFFKKEISLHLPAQSYFHSTKVSWYWFVIALSITTMLAVFTIPDSAYPIMYVRSIFGATFVFLLPGYAFLKMLFPSQVLIKTSSENMEKAERIALSFGVSLALVSIVGLILNYTPLGIRLAPITLSLLSLTIVFATAAALREYQAQAVKVSA